MSGALDALQAEVARMEAREAKAHAIAQQALAESTRLRDALRAAAASLETLAALSGKEELLRTMPDVRAFANSRAHVALGALLADPDAERRAA
jgi:hypothetical protein